MLVVVSFMRLSSEVTIDSTEIRDAPRTSSSPSAGSFFFSKATQSHTHSSQSYEVTVARSKLEARQQATVYGTLYELCDGKMTGSSRENTICRDQRRKNLRSLLFAW